MALTTTQAEVIRRCQKSTLFFLKNFGKTKHPTAGILPLNPFSYQIRALNAFRKYRFNIFKKSRQTGASKIAGAFALWFAMFFSNKTVLIVSRTDEDAINFLRENIIFLFRYLPQWMQDAWKPTKENEHEVRFPNGSRIRSLTSHPDVLRSNASSLNIIDEAAFIRDMGVMWAAGQPTLIHGGSVIVVSTTAGVGGWYWSTWTDAVAGLNDFHPININWWDMDWEIRYRDDMTGEIKVIAPTAGIRDCVTAEEIEKYGPKWSPWLEEQYRGLQERGETWKFKQEILAEFVGSGSTIVDPKVLAYLQTLLSDDYKRVKGMQTYLHPVKNEHMSINFNGGDRRDLDKDEGLWIWRKPNHGKPPIYQGKRLINPGEQPHRYSIGVDIATGKGRDYFGLQVLDIDAQEQAAEFMIRTLPKYFKLLADYIGRWYNNAMMVIERNNGGDAFIDDMRYDLMYPNLWRKKDINDKPTSSARKNSIQLADYGFYTGQASKPTLNKALVDYLQPDGGYKIYSHRLLKQLNIYVRKKDRAGRDTDKTEAEDGPGNHDDLVISLGLACIGINDAATQIVGGLIPFQESMQTELGIPDNDKIKLDPSILSPMSGFSEMSIDASISGEIIRFAEQLGALPIETKNLPPTANKKYTLIK
ncbi:MAG: terminase family protein [Candidatus Cloacimonetes bacterium]|jgi:hypothetical protein|nr:terminase family protein [Candidatus Cloacimonadota bacterium]